jgi:hypothetical protein
MKATLCGGPSDGQTVEVEQDQDAVYIPMMGPILRNGERFGAVWDPDGTKLAHMTNWNLRGIEPPPEHDRRPVWTQAEYRRTGRTTDDGLPVFALVTEAG